MFVYIICNNDGMHYAIVGTGDDVADNAKAEKKKIKLKKAYEEKLIKQFGEKDGKDHISACFWHIHNVEGEVAS